MTGPQGAAVNTGATGPTGAGSAGNTGFAASDATWVQPPTATGGWTGSFIHTGANYTDNWIQGGSPTGTTSIFVNDGATAAADAVSCVFNSVTNGGTGTTNGWRATGRFRLWTPIKSQYGVMGLCTSDGTKIEFWGVGGNNNPTWVLSQWNTNTSKNTEANKQGIFNATQDIMMRDFWIRAYYTGGNLAYQISYDGFSWVTYFSQAIGTFCVPKYVGWGGGWNGNPVNYAKGQIWFECQSWQYQDL
jgi:hypothetical protein